jgi:hypothetical protein
MTANKDEEIANWADFSILGNKKPYSAIIA